MRINTHPYLSALSSFVPVVALASALTILTGCSGFTIIPREPSLAGIRLSGAAMGGQQPLTGSRIYLFAAGSTGYASPSTSLLNTATLGVSTYTNNNGYVNTDSNGSFSITGDWSCAHASDQLYLVATGGNPSLTAGTNNTAIVLMDALGTCSLVTGSTTIVISELSTVAATTALQQFMADSTHVGASATNAAGLANAFLNATNLVPVVATSARIITPSSNGSVPQSKLHSLANVIAACVNTSSIASSQCSSLFTNATPSGGAAPTNSLTAALDIAQNPAHNVSALFSLSTPTPAFQPSLSSAPADWTVGITYSLGSGTPLPGYVAVDGSGNVWISNLASEKSPAGTDSIIEIGPQGALLSGTGYTAGGTVSLPEGLAIDDTGNVWVANTPSSVIKLNSSGSMIFTFEGGVYPQDIALDTSGNAWVTNSQGTDVMLISLGGTYLNDVTSTNFGSPQGVVIDAAGNIWAAGAGSNSLLKFSSAGTVLSGSGAGFTGGGLNAPTGIGIDAAGNILAVNSTYGSSAPSISKFTNAGAPTSSSLGYGTGQPGYENILAIDGASTVWSASCGPNCVGQGSDNIIHLASNGTVLTPTSGYLDSNYLSPQAVAVDASGNLWIGNSAGQANSVAGTVTQLIGVAVPVKTPIQAALKSNLLGQRP